MKNPETIIYLLLVTGLALIANGMRVAVKTKFRDWVAMNWLLAGDLLVQFAVMLSKIFL